MSTILCSCGKAFKADRYSGTSAFRRHVRNNPGHHETRRWTFGDHDNASLVREDTPEEVRA